MVYPPMGGADAELRAATMLGSAVDAAERVSSYAGNHVFRVRRGDEFWYLKSAAFPGAGEDLRREFRVMELVEGHGVPVARVEAYDLADTILDAPCLLLREVPGLPLTGSEPAWRRIGSILRAVHDIQLDRFGLLIASQLAGQHASWMDFIEEALTSVQPMVAAGLVDAELAIDWEKLSRIGEPRLPAIREDSCTETFIRGTSTRIRARSRALSTGATRCRVTRSTTWSPDSASR